MRRPAITPFVATAVAMIGAATIVANPVITPPADIRISASDLEAHSSSLAVLDLGLLDSVGAVGSGAPSTVLNRVLSFGIAEDTTPVGYNSLNDALLRAAGKDPVLLVGVMAFASPSGTGPQLPSTPDTVMSPADLLRALASLSSGFGEGGADFIREAGMAPAVILDLTQQVLAGTMAPDEALRQLLAAPLSASTNNPGLTANLEDAVFNNGLLKTIIDVLIANSPLELGTGVIGLIGTNTDPTAVVQGTKETATATSVTADAADSTEERPKKTDETIGTGESGAVSAPNLGSAGVPVDIADSIREQVQQATDVLRRKNQSGTPSPIGTSASTKPGSSAGPGTSGSGAAAGSAGSGAAAGSPGSSAGAAPGK